MILRSGVVKGGGGGEGGDRPPNGVQDHSKSLLNPCRSWGGNTRMPSPLATCPSPKTMTLATPLILCNISHFTHLF